MTLAPNLFGEELYVGSAKDEVARLLEKFPAAKTNPAILYWAVACERCPWIAQLDSKRQFELRDLFYAVESVRRRRQDLLAKDRSQQRG